VTTAVLFDMDGVLVDTEPVINLAAINGLREYGVEAVPSDFEPFVGAGEDRYIGGVAEAHGVSYKKEMKARVYEIYLELLPDMVKKFPGVRELLEKIMAENILLGLATSADRIKMEANLRAIDVPLDWFAKIVTGEDVEEKKPDPAIYLACAAGVGVAPANCCVVEDALNGVVAAKAAGMRCAAVATSFSQRQLLDAGADFVCSGISELSLDSLAIHAGSVAAECE
jgi:beta-phosphoglucomutase